MSGSQQIVGAGGAALVVLSFWTGDSRKVIDTGLLSDSPTSKQQAAARKELTKVGASILFREQRQASRTPCGEKTRTPRSWKSR